MDKYIEFIFKHKRDKDEIIEKWTIIELIYGVGETKQSVKELIEIYKEDGYVLTDTIIK